MSSREGDVVEIAWLFDRIGQAIEERGSQSHQELIAGALRYQFLKAKVGSDVVFDINEAVSLQGNSGSYLQYAHARARSILNKTSVSAKMPDRLDEAERMLVRKLSENYDVIDRAVKDLTPHVVCTYLYELAQTFNRFYEATRIIGEAREAERLYLVDLYAQTLARGLKLLGIQAPDKM
jgi:arginyl-tRNA synthetase